MPKILDVNSYSGITETFEEVEGKVQIHKSADISQELANNRRELNEKKSGWQGGWHKVASIPTIMIEIWREEMKKKGYPNVNPLAVVNRPFLIAKLNNRDLNKLRTKEGRL